MTDNNDHNQPPRSAASDGVPEIHDPQGTAPIAPTPPDAWAGTSSALANDPATAVRTVDRPERGFFQRTWVRIVAAAVAAVILLGGGIGLGWAVSRGTEGGHGSNADQQSDSNGGGFADRRGDGSGDGNSPRDRGNPKDHNDPNQSSTPAPVPTAP